MAVIGIDLGTTNSAGACYDGASPIILPSSRPDGLVPSVVMFRKGDFLVGQQALEFAYRDPEKRCLLHQTADGTSSRRTQGGGSSRPRQLRHCTQQQGR